MMSEILQETLGILIKKEYLKNETQAIEKRKPAINSLYLETNVKERGMLYERILSYDMG